jgi:hypothetical protein
MIHWDKCKEDFRWDGSLRDIYISPADLNDWKMVYAHLRDFPAVEFSLDGILQPPPATIEQVFAARSSCNPMFRLKVGRASVVFHFFSEDEIECDFDPREVSSKSDLDRLLEFIRQLGDMTHKRIVITPENLRDKPIISYEPDTRCFQYHDVAD